MVEGFVLRDGNRVWRPCYESMRNENVVQDTKPHAGETTQFMEITSSLCGAPRILLHPDYRCGQ